MKKVICLFATLFVVAAMFASCDKKEIITESELPSLSREFLKAHFNGVSVSRIVKETEGFDKSYTVYLSNAFEIDFFKSGEWDEVDGHINALPQSISDLLPAGIMQYVNANFPNSKIVKVNKERYGYEIELNNDLELEFNLKGEFFKMD